MRAASILLLTVLIAACASAPVSTNNPLSHTDWELRSIVEGSDSLTVVPPDGLHFTTASDVHIRSCNTCNGSYSVDGDQLMTGPMACTRRACEQGRPELANLINDLSTFRLLGDWLIIESNDRSLRRLYFAPGASWEGN